MFKVTYTIPGMDGETIIPWLSGKHGEDFFNGREVHWSADEERVAPAAPQRVVPRRIPPQREEVVPEPIRAGGPLIDEKEALKVKVEAVPALKPKPTKRGRNANERPSAKSIPAQLREITGYIDSAATMKILNIEKTAFYAQVKSGLIPVTRWGSDFRIDPLVLADRLEGVTT